MCIRNSTAASRVIALPFRASVLLFYFFCKVVLPDSCWKPWCQLINDRGVDGSVVESILKMELVWYRYFICLVAGLHYFVNFLLHLGEIKVQLLQDGQSQPGEDTKPDN